MIQFSMFLKPFLGLMLCMLITVTGYSQMPLWKKSLYVGSGMTVGGVGALAAGSYMLAIGAPAFFSDNDDDAVTAASAGLLAGGIVLAVAGTTFTITGPFIIRNGVRARREEKKPGPAFGFAPIKNKLLDKYYSNNSRKFATVSFMF
ncbi:MAG TPA: hypothetical protein VK154_05490 [Chitinophagales bacterium]|nr:hypothetical protein [Chitinophagales bacterium]